MQLVFGSIYHCFVMSFKRKVSIYADSKLKYSKFNRICALNFAGNS